MELIVLCNFNRLSIRYFTYIFLIENRSRNIVNQQVLKKINIRDIGLYEGPNTVLC